MSNVKYFFQFSIFNLNHQKDPQAAASCSDCPVAFHGSIAQITRSSLPGRAGMPSP